MKSRPKATMSAAGGRGVEGALAVVAVAGNVGATEGLAQGLVVEAARAVLGVRLALHHVQVGQAAPAISRPADARWAEERAASGARGPEARGGGVAGAWPATRG